MNWKMTKLSLAAACAMALAATPALAYGPSGQWNGANHTYKYGDNNNHGYHAYNNSDSNGEYGYNNANPGRFGNGEDSYRNREYGYGNQNGYQGRTGERNGEYGYNQYNRNGYMNREGRYQNDETNDRGFNNRMNGEDGGYASNGYDRGGDQGSYYGQYLYNGTGRPNGHVGYNYSNNENPSFVRGHACYTMNCNR